VTIRFANFVGATGRISQNRSVFMKNTIKLKAIRRMTGVIALIAVVGFLMVACNNGSTGSSKKGDGSGDSSKSDYTTGTYTLYGADADGNFVVTMSSSEYTALAGGDAPVSPGYVAIGTKKKAASLSAVTGSDLNGEVTTGLKWNDVETGINDNFTGDAKTNIINKLKNDGYCVIGINNGTDITVAAVFKD
jgi:hypothetical protein